MKVTFLGTGTSFGIPVIGCPCEVCRSADPRNRRTRHALLLEHGEGRLLVDTPPELRLQLVREGITRLDGVFITHPHADHVHGLDDLRIFSHRTERPLPVFVASEYRDEMRARFSYIWSEDAGAQPGTTIPDLDLVAFEDGEELCVAGIRFRAIGFPHGRYRSYGLRAGDVAVIVDAKAVPPSAAPLLEGVRVLVINALWRGNPHPTHFNVEEAVEVARRLGAERTYLTHLTHRLEHAELEAGLPDGVRPAYDGLAVEV